MEQGGSGLSGRVGKRNRNEHPQLRERAIKTVDRLLDEELFTPKAKETRPFKTCFIEDAGGKYRYIDPRWHIDHFYIDEDGFATQHPYSISMEKLKDVIQWCDENRYTFTIDAASAYFPAHTFRIRFHRVDESGPTYVNTGRRQQ